MNDALFSGLDFGDDESLAGFRLQRLEILNWGTFNTTTYVVNLNGRNGLLTGDIGSGKSTVVDAITTLLVPPAKISYNKAAGAETKERSLATYALGHYKTEKSESGASTRAVSLRDHKQVSVLLAEFRNDGYDQTLTLAQVFYFKKTEGQPERFYVLSPDSLSIEQDFRPKSNSIPDLRKSLRNKGCSVEDSFEKYRAEFSRTLGIRNPQALDLFHQTVSMKQVGNLTHFVRSHMLEPFDIKKRRDKLLEHFENLQRAHAAIQKAKHQIELLSPLCERLQALTNTKTTLQNERSAREGLTIYFAGLKCSLLEVRIEKLGADIEQVTKRLESLAIAIRQLRSEEVDLEVDIKGRGGDRLQQLQSEYDRLSLAVDQRREKLHKYTTHATDAGLDAPKSAEELAAIQQAASAKLTELAQQSDRLENESTELSFELRTQREAVRKLVDEIDSLRKRENNLPGNVIDMRERICAGTGLTAKELPYVGEVLAVHEEHLAWEGAAERVLRPFSLSLLVPQEHYRTVADWVNTNSLRGRLVYYRVAQEKRERHDPSSSASLVHALRIKPGCEQTDWLYGELVRRFDYVRCTTMDEFSRHNKAITASGHIKSSRSKHEKDDRSDLKNRSRYTLGWSNKEKIAILMRTRDEAMSEVQRVNAMLNTLAAKRIQLGRAADGCKGVQNFSEFQELDWESAAREQQRVATSIREIEESSNVLASLRDQLAAVKTKITDTEQQQSKASQEHGALTSRVENASATLSTVRVTVAADPLDDTTSERIAWWCEHVIPNVTMTVENCDSNQQKIRKSIQDKMDGLSRQVERHQTFVVAKMQEFRGHYPVESRDFDADVDAGAEYQQLLAKLQGDDLPRFAAAFKEMLNRNALHEIASFHTALDNEAHEITSRISLINEALSAIDYNPGRHIVLERHAGRDREVEEFKADLRACVSDTVGGDSSDSYSEARFEQVKKILDRFALRDGTAEADKRWTDKVTDVRNWFSFSASERWKEDGTEHEHYTDSGGKSGGQKEKLAYTILAASLAYKFGLDWGEVRSRSMRFVVIDEAFGRGSDESAEYGLTLFKKLNLQLMIVTPLQKIKVIEPHVSSVTFVSNPSGSISHLRTLTMEEYNEAKVNQDSVGDTSAQKPVESRVVLESSEGNSHAQVRTDDVTLAESPAQNLDNTNADVGRSPDGATKGDEATSSDADVPDSGPGDGEVPDEPASVLDIPGLP